MLLSDAVLVIAGLLSLSIVTAGLFRRFPVPHTVLLVVLGMALAQAAEHVSVLGPVAAFRLTPELVLFVFLPALIFESAFNLNARELIRNLVPVLVLAIPALLVSTAMIGMSLWWATGLSLVVALVFGALISATDPVAVVALFRELGAPGRLTILVEGESLLNDATAIVLCNILLGVAMTGALGWGVAGSAAGEFARVFVGGALVGAVLGWAASELVYRLKSPPSALVVMTFVTAYAGFALAEHAWHVSGVMAAMTAALVFAALCVTRVSHKTVEFAREVWEVVALVANSMLFILIGISVRPIELIDDLGLIAVAVAIMLAARAICIYTMVPATVRAFRLARIGPAEQHIMFWGGLRGGVAIAIVLSLPETLPGRELLTHLALGAVLFTLLVNATTVRPLIQWLGIDRMSPDEQSELNDGLRGAENAALALVERFHGAGLISEAARDQVSRRARALFESATPRLEAAQRERHMHRDAVRAESEALDALHEQALVDAYTYLDMRSTLARDRESPAAVAGPTAPPPPVNPFQRLETALLHALREHDWAAGLLARYQSLRVAQRLERDIAGVVTAQAALQNITAGTDAPEAARQSMIGVYRDRLQRRQRRMAALRNEFPEFYQGFETWLYERAMLVAAERWLARASHNGQLGSKVVNRIAARIQQRREAMPPAAQAAPKPSAQALLERVPLCAGFSGPSLREAARRATFVSFLAGDVIIGEGDHGDALYVISQGSVSVSRRTTSGAMEELAVLGVGEFFGEHALLGAHVRSASVIAATPCTLLRLTRRAILGLAEVDPEVAERLRAADRSRQEDTA